MRAALLGALPGVMPLVRPLRYAPRERLQEFGERSHGVWILVSGDVSVLPKDRWGFTQATQVRSTGAVFGDLDPDAAPGEAGFQAEAETEVVAVLIPSEEAARVVQAAPALADALTYASVQFHTRHHFHSLLVERVPPRLVPPGVLAAFLDRAERVVLEIGGRAVLAGQPFPGVDMVLSAGFARTPRGS